VSVRQSEVVKVSRSDIVRNPEWQVREKLNASRVKDYRGIYKAGASMPPIELADIKGTLYLVDGWHRYEAQAELGWTHFEATITPMTKNDARARAAMANLTHGESYKKPERRKAFRVFIETKQNKARGGKLMSYRDMARAFGGGASHVTIRNWVKADHPALFKALEKGRSGDWSPDMLEHKAGPTEEQRDMARVQALLVDVVAQSKSIYSAAGRKHLDSMVLSAHEAIVKRKAYVAIPVPVLPESGF